MRVVVDLTDVVSAARDDGIDCHFQVTTEVQGLDKPACAADIIVRYYPESPA